MDAVVWKLTQVSVAYGRNLINIICVLMIMFFRSGKTIKMWVHKKKSQELTHEQPVKRALCFIWLAFEGQLLYK